LALRRFDLNEVASHFGCGQYRAADDVLAVSLVLKLGVGLGERFS
jgi:hypothetical protein